MKFFVDTSNNLGRARWNVFVDRHDYTAIVFGGMIPRRPERTHCPTTWRDGCHVLRAVGDERLEFI